MKRIVSLDEAATVQVGRDLATRLPSPRTVCLTGELGSGKTAFTRGFAAGLGMSDTSQVHSPTFTLVNQYPTPAGILYHVDLYRLDTERDFYSIGLEELVWGEHFVVIEWAEKLTWDVPNPLRLRFTVQPDESRIIEVDFESVEPAGRH